MATKHNIPGSSLPELQKIIQAYASSKDAMSLDDVSKKAAMNSTVISRNAKFLVDLSVIKGGAKKQATDTGRKYARALEHKQEDAARKILAECVTQCEFLSDLVTTIRIKDGMAVTDFAKHVLYSANQASNGPNKTGANAIGDILMAAGLVTNDDGMLNVATTSAPETQESTDTPPKVDPPKADPPTADPPTVEEKIVHTAANSKHPDVSINISLQIPESDDPEIYDRFFKAMKKNLFPDD